MVVLSDTIDQNGEEPKKRSSACGPAIEIDWALLARCLTFGSPNDTPLFEKAICRASALGAVPFEVVAGSPAARYGARITFRLPTNKRPFLDEFGLSGHPSCLLYGEPEWVGLRIAQAGELVAKPYHARVNPCTPPPHLESLSARLFPVMSSLHLDLREDYFRFHDICEWPWFVQTCTGIWNAGGALFEPAPKPVHSSFCVSVQYREQQLQVITVFADYRSLPDDQSIRHLWPKDMTAQDAESYELTLAAVRASGARRLGSWHAMLSWTLERSGNRHKAASLRFPSIKPTEV